MSAMSPRLPGLKTSPTSGNRNAACLGFLVVLTCPAAWGQIGWRGTKPGQRPRGFDGCETVEFDVTAGGISSLCGGGGERRGIQPARGDIGIAVWRAVRGGF